MPHLFRLVLLVLVMSGCTPRGALTLYPPAAQIGTEQTIYVGTTRGADLDTGDAFGWAREPDARFARFSIAVPPVRTAGEISWPKQGREIDPMTQFLTTKRNFYADSATFRRDLATSLRNEPRGRREAVVFVHGFNNTFAEGLYRIAQLDQDLGLSGISVHYSWPSRANPLGYAYDRDSALFARDGFEDLLEQISDAGAERIVIVAHSMGAALSMETLRQLAIGGRTSVIDRIAGVLLISPDIDVDVFRAQATRIGALPQPFLIFTSKRDRALVLSARLTGQSGRLGNVTDVEDVADLEVTLLDVSAFSSGLGHFALGDSPILLQILSGIGDIGNAFADDQSGRTGLLPGAVLTVQNATSIVLSPVTAIAGVAQ